MKRFVGLLLSLAGAAGVVWGGYHCLTGQSTTPVHLPGDFTVTAMVVGLAGLAVGTVGLVWARE